MAHQITNALIAMLYSGMQSELNLNPLAVMTPLFTIIVVEVERYLSHLLNLVLNLWPHWLPLAVVPVRTSS